MRSSSTARAGHPKSDPKRPKREKENPEYLAFARRMIKAGGRRIGEGDIENLGMLANLNEVVEEATQDAVRGLRRLGYSWKEIGRALGIAKQNAHKRFRQVEEVVEA